MTQNTPPKISGGINLPNNFNMPSMPNLPKKDIPKSFYLIALLLILIFMAIFTVRTGTKDIVFTAGKATSVADEGLHFKIPFYQSTKTIDIKTQTAINNASAASKDLQIVTSEISVNFHFDPDRLIEIQLATGFDVADKIISPRIQETLKSVSAEYSAEELITKRQEAKSKIDEKLRNDLLRYNIIVEDVQLTDFRFSEEFNSAIESKQTEVQETLKAKNILERNRIEAEQQIVKAKAEAEQIRIQAEAIRNQGGEAYVQLKMIEKWDGKLPTVSGGAADMLINPAQLKK